MPTKKKRPATQPSVLAQIRPLLKPLLKPVVEPVLTQLARHAEILEEIKKAAQVQFIRTAEIQAQLDKLLATLARTPRND